MENSFKVKKTIDKKHQDNLIQWKYKLLDMETWEIIEAKVKSSKYKLKLSNNKQFMKKWTDRKLNIAIKKWLSLLEKEILFDLLDYIDENNIINFKLLALDYEYSPSKISKARWLLEEKWLVRKINWLYYLNPIVWIIWKEIPQDLLLEFKDTFEKYWVDVDFN